MLLATIGTDENICACLRKVSIFLTWHVLNTLINEVEIYFMAGVERSLGQPMDG
jgi:hypothetical protein